MEIVFDDVSYKDFKNLSFTLKNRTINGINLDNSQDIFTLLKGKEKFLGSIYFGNVLLSDNTKDEYRNLISFVPKNFSNQVFLDTVEEYIAFTIKYRKIKVKNQRKTVISLLEHIGLNESYLDKNIEELSSSEQKLIQVIVSLLSRPKVVVLEEVFSNFDLKFEKKLMRFFNYLIDNENITIVLISRDAEMLYKNSKHVVLIKNGEVLSEGESVDVYKNVELLLDNDFEVPEIVLFTYKVQKQKNINLSYHKDIRDLIKDVYKNV